MIENDIIVCHFNEPFLPLLELNTLKFGVNVPLSNLDESSSFFSILKFWRSIYDLWDFQPLFWAGLERMISTIFIIHKFYSLLAFIILAWRFLSEEVSEYCIEDACEGIDFYLSEKLNTRIFVDLKLKF